MAKKIIFSFSNIPSLGLNFNLIINYLGLPIYFNSGEDSISLEYLIQGSQDIPPLKVEVQGTLNATIEKTLSFLNTYYYNDNIVYQKVNNTIEATITLDNLSFSITNQIPELIITTQDISDAQNLNLKYFFQYTNIVGDAFLCQIFKKRYLGLPIEVQGSATLEKGSVKNHTDTIRGTNLSIELEANLNLTFEDLYTENEQDYTVIFKRNDKVMFRGFLKPDGIFQSYRDDYWIISLDCVDGLGSLENLSFVKESGFRFNGKMKVQEVLYNSLKRTGILMPINVSINVLYDGLINTQNTNILNEIFINTDRFFKEDSQGTGDGTIMSCDEVIKSILGIFRANITQEAGEWYIYKADEIYKDATTLFKRYDINNIYVGNKNINLNKEIGSQINNYYPHFSNGDQNIKIQGGINAFRLGYKYGFLNNLLPNGKLTRVGTDFDLWTETPSLQSLIINDPQRPSGLILKSLPLNSQTNIILTSTTIQVDKGDLFDFKGSLTISGSSVFFGFRVSIGSNYMDNNGIWNTNPATLFTTLVESSATYFNEQNLSFKVSISPAPISGNLKVEIYQPLAGFFNPTNNYVPLAIIRSLDITTNSAELSGKVGEFHTVERTTKISSIIKENISVIIGDEIDNFYSGTIFKNDGLEKTSIWNRVGTFENYPLLRISAETELRLGQKPLMQFNGTVYGYISYLTMISINNLLGKFMPIKYVYDTKANTVKFELLEVIADEIPDINYKFTFDYGGNTVKPTIVG